MSSKESRLKHLEKILVATLFILLHLKPCLIIHRGDILIMAFDRHMVEMNSTAGKVNSVDIVVCRCVITWDDRLSTLADRGIRLWPGIRIHLKGAGETEPKTI